MQDRDFDFEGFTSPFVVSEQTEMINGNIPFHQWADTYGNPDNFSIGSPARRKARREKRQERKDRRFDARMARKESKVNARNARADFKRAKGEAKIKLAERGISEPSGLQQTLSGIAALTGKGQSQAQLPDYGGGMQGGDVSTPYTSGVSFPGEETPQEPGQGTQQQQQAQPGENTPAKPQGSNTTLIIVAALVVVVLLFMFLKRK